MNEDFKFNWTIQHMNQEPVWDSEAYVLDKLKNTSFLTIFGLIAPEVLKSSDFLMRWLSQEKISNAQLFVESASKKWESHSAQLLEFFTSEPYLEALSLKLKQHSADNSNTALYTYYVFFALLRAKDNIDNLEFEKKIPLEQRQKNYQLFSTERLFHARTGFIEREARDLGDLLSFHLPASEIKEAIQRIRSVLIEPHKTLFLQEFGFSLFNLDDFKLLSEEEKQLGFFHCLEKPRETFRFKDIESALSIEFIFNQATLIKYLSIAIKENSYLLYDKKDILEFKEKYKSLLSCLKLEDLKNIIGWDKAGFEQQSFDKLKKILPQFFLTSNPAWRLELEQNPQLIDEKSARQFIKKDPLWLQEIINKHSYNCPKIAAHLTAEYIAQYVKDIQVIENLGEYLSLEVLENKSFPTNLFTEKLVLHYIQNYPFLDKDKFPLPVCNYLEQESNILKAIETNYDIYRLLPPQTQALPQVYFKYLNTLCDKQVSMHDSRRYIFESFTSHILSQPKEAVHVFALSDNVMRQTLLKLVPDTAWEDSTFILSFSQALDKDKNLFEKLKLSIPFKIKEYIEANATQIQNIGSYTQFFEIEIQKQYLQASLSIKTQNTHKKHKI